VRGVYYEAVGVILTLILLGRLFEAKAKAGTGEAIRALIGLQQNRSVDQEVTHVPAGCGRHLVAGYRGDLLASDGDVRR